MRFSLLALTLASCAVAVTIIVPKEPVPSVPTPCMSLCSASCSVQFAIESASCSLQTTSACSEAADTQNFACNSACAISCAPVSHRTRSRRAIH